MADDQHPLIAESVKHSDNQSLSLPELADNSVAHFVLMQPQARTQVLQQLDTAMQMDAPLRQRAQLLNLSRTLSDTHAMMRRAGR